MQQGDRVGYINRDDAEQRLWHGQPGRVVSTDLWPSEIIVAFINGPTVCLPPAAVAALDDATYAERARAVLNLRHPTDRGRAIPQLWAELEPWEDDEVARAHRG
jgi:hypothetical protein